MSTVLQQPPIFQQSPLQPWWRGLTRRQWLTLIIAYMGWVFDIVDMFLFVIVKEPAMRDLLSARGTTPADADVALYGGIGMAITLVGWSIGGLVFGIVADRWGRSRTMALTILIYSLFTGLTGFARTPEELFALRFLAALGIGGEWGTGASMVAEVFPVRSRAVAAGILQSASGAGFFIATFIWLLVQKTVEGGEKWRYMFFIGAVPAVLALIVRMKISETPAWVASREAAKTKAPRATLGEIFGDATLRKRALLGTALAVVGIFAYWGTTFWAIDALSAILKSKQVQGEDLTNKIFAGQMVLNLGILIGFFVYIPFTEWVGRKRAFFWFYLASAISVPVAYLCSNSYESWLGLFFVAGMFTSGIYSGYTIYFPELFPTRVRATGASFCYNVGRVVAAPGPVLKGHLLHVFGSGAIAGAVIGGVYLLGLLVIPFLPETRGIKLDEGD